LAVADADLKARLRERLSRDDDYVRAGKPLCDYDDAAARDELVDALARDAYALLACLDEPRLELGLDKAAKLLAAVVGQDLDQDADDGMFRIAPRSPATPSSLTAFALRLRTTRVWAQVLARRPRPVCPGKWWRGR